MDETDPATPHSQSAGIARWIALSFGLAEDWLGFFFANLLTIGIAGFLELMTEYAWHEGNWIAKALHLLALLAWVVLDLPYLFRLWRSAFRWGRHPALVTARSQRMWPYPLRLLIVVWWLLHFLAGELLVIEFQRNTKPGESLEPAVGFFMATCSSFAANGYFILAIASITRDETIRQKCWRGRVFLDLLVGTLAWWLERYE